MTEDRNICLFLTLAFHLSLLLGIWTLSNLVSNSRRHWLVSINSLLLFTADNWVDSVDCVFLVVVIHHPWTHSPAPPGVYNPKRGLARKPDLVPILLCQRLVLPTEPETLLDKGQVKSSFFKATFEGRPNPFWRRTGSFWQKSCASQTRPFSAAWLFWRGTAAHPRPLLHDVDDLPVTARPPLESRRQTLQNCNMLPDSRQWAAAVVVWFLQFLFLTAPTA